MVRYFVTFLLTLCAQRGFAQPQVSAPGALKTPSTFVSSNEIYSETNYISDLDGAANQTRLRHQIPLGSYELQAYVGLVIDRNLIDTANAPVVESAISPNLGLLYRPFPYMTAWAEYRQRFVETTRYTSSRSEGDPRFGIALGHLLYGPTARFNAEVYGESIWVPRWSRDAILSGFARTFARNKLGGYGVADIYAEVNAYRVPDPALGLSRNQLRLGGRYALYSGAWSGQLFVYKPWTLEREEIRDTGLEGLFVLGGTF